MSKELKKCALCEAEFTPCKFNFSRHKYCKGDACLRQRKKLSNKKFLLDNPDYFKGRYRASQDSVSPEAEADLSVVELEKRILANDSRLNEQSQVFENQFSLLAGMAIKLSGSLAQASAFWLRDFLSSCYEEGTSLLLGQSELNNKNLMEIFHEFSAQYIESRARAPDS